MTVEETVGLTAKLLRQLLLLPNMLQSIVTSGVSSEQFFAMFDKKWPQV